MITLPLAAIGMALMGLLLSGMAVFLILLVLVQRGRGGGLAGALGGMGGSSAFGAKAGDIFTKITVGAAGIWIVLCIVAARWGGSSENLLNISTTPSRTAPPGASANVAPGEEPAATTPPADAEGPAMTPPADADGAGDAEPAGEPAAENEPATGDAN